MTFLKHRKTFTFASNEFVDTTYDTTYNVDRRYENV